MHTVRKLSLLHNALLFILVLSLTSCLEVRQQININKDGSGDSKIEVFIQREWAPQIIPQLKADIPKGWSILDEGEREGKQIIVIGKNFKDISELNDLYKDEISFNFSTEKKDFLKKSYIVRAELKNANIRSPFDIVLKMPGGIDKNDGFKISSNKVKWSLQGIHRRTLYSVKSSAIAMPDFASLKESFNKAFNSVFYSEAIVFLRDSNIWVMDSDGANQRQLTKEGVGNWSISRKGEIVFDRFAFSDESNRLIDPNIYIVSVANKAINNLTNDNKSIAPAISPDGNKVAFVKVEETFNSIEAQQRDYIRNGLPKKTSIYIIDITTGQQQKVVAELPPQLIPEHMRGNVTEWLDTSLFWSEDGSRLHFSRDFVPYYPSGRIIPTYLVNLSSGNIEFIGNQGHILHWAGDKILYTSEGNVWIYNTITKKQQELGEMMSGAVSLDGSKVAYTEFTNKKEGDRYVWWNTLYIKDMSSNKKTKLLTSDKNEDLQVLLWSVDEKKILFNRSTFDEKSQVRKSVLCNIDADGTNLKKIMDANCNFPNWLSIPRISFISPNMAKTIILGAMMLTGLLLFFGMVLIARKAIKAAAPKPKPKIAAASNNIFCTQCGTENPASASFCKKCGNKLR